MARRTTAVKIGSFLDESLNKKILTSIKYNIVDVITHGIDKWMYLCSNPTDDW